MTNNYEYSAQIPLDKHPDQSFVFYAWLILICSDKLCIVIT